MAGGAPFEDGAHLKAIVRLLRFYICCMCERLYACMWHVEEIYIMIRFHKYTAASHFQWGPRGGNVASLRDTKTMEIFSPRT